MTDKEIIQKLTVELEFVASTFGARSNLSPRKYAQMLLDFIQTAQGQQPDGLQVGDRVVGFWGAMHAPDFGVIDQIGSSVVRIVWDDDDTADIRERDDIGGDWFEQDTPRPGLYLYEKAAA